MSKMILKMSTLIFIMAAVSGCSIRPDSGKVEAVETRVELSGERSTESDLLGVTLIRFDDQPALENRAHCEESGVVRSLLLDIEDR